MKPTEPKWGNTRGYVVSTKKLHYKKSKPESGFRRLTRFWQQQTTTAKCNEVKGRHVWCGMRYRFDQ